MKDRLLVILGPTATGKSKLAITLARRLGGEIISGDAFLVYKGMDIGTAKPAKEDLQSVRHHLIDILSPGENYNAAIFQEMAGALIRRINQAGILPILVGGTGLYIQSLLEGYTFPPGGEDSQLRGELSAFAEKFGDAALYERLRALAPDSAARVHPHNRQRVVRALEAAAQGGISRQKQPDLVYDAGVFGLSLPRDTLYQRINQRVEEMFAGGLTEEVKNLIIRGVPRQTAALQGIGYKEVIGYLNGEYTRETCAQLVARNTRRLAKRQFTWYKRMPYIQWLAAADGANDDTPADNICEKLVEWRILR